MSGAYTVSTYPFDPVRLSCSKCDRKGQYRKATLLERFGPDAAMPDVLHALANCQHHKQSDRCMVIYPDLARTGPAQKLTD